MPLAMAAKAKTDKVAPPEVAMLLERATSAEHSKRVGPTLLDKRKGLGSGLATPAKQDPNAYDKIMVICVWNKEESPLTKATAEVVQAPVTAATACLVPSTMAPDKQQPLAKPLLKAKTTPPITAKFMGIVLGSEAATTFVGAYRGNATGADFLNVVVDADADEADVAPTRSTNAARTDRRTNMEIMRMKELKNRTKSDFMTNKMRTKAKSYCGIRTMT
jgi:hypothetical protein